MGAPAVTVVVPTRNRARILPDTVHSILAQHDVTVSVVVVDDASTDDTCAVVQGMPGVHLVRHERPTEQRVARNHGASVASAPWVAFCDDDDLWAPTKLRRQLDAMAAAGADWCTTSALLVDGDLVPIGAKRLRDGRRIARHITDENVVPGGGSGVLIRRTLFEHVGGFNEAARYAEDWDLWIRLARHGKVACVDELLLAYRLWPLSFSHNAFDSQYAAFRALTDSVAGNGSGRGRRPKGTSASEVSRRRSSEGRRPIVKDIPRLLFRAPGDTIPILLMMGLPNSILKELRLMRLGRDERKVANAWLAPYRDALNARSDLAQ